MLNEESYLKRRTQSWRRLELLCDKADTGGFRKLSGLEVVEYVRLYRQTSADLAFLMTHSSNKDVVAHLNRLVGRAYAMLYRAPSRSFLKVIDDGLFAAASTMRRHRGLFWLSAGILGLAAAFAFFVMTTRPEMRHFFVDPSMEANFDSWKSGEFDPRTGGEGVMATSFYWANNLRAGMTAVGIASATAGVGAVYVLWMNGAILGALSADMAGVGLLPYLWISIAPHGVSEMGGFIVAAAAGFLIARAVLMPGNKSRGDAVRHAGKDAFVMFILALVMIGLAAPIEGFFSFNPLVPLPVKALAAGLLFVAWTLFFTRYGLKREKLEEEAEAARRSLGGV